MRQPNFDNLLRVLQHKKPDRPTLFEMFMNIPVYEYLAGERHPGTYNTPEEVLFLARAFMAGGYDYVTVHGSGFSFPSTEKAHAATVSLNDGGMISDRRTFEEYPWPDPEDADYSKLSAVEGHLPEGMKIMVMGPGGVLENVIALTGYDNLCFLLYDEPELVQDIFDAVGERLVRYYELAVHNDSVGVLMSNDDWGFNTQTFLSTEDMQKFVYPWHKKIVEVGHKVGKPVLLHSCGNFDVAMEDVIELMCYDGKHSYEDAILPVEDSYERWGSRIAILGGIDIDFIVRAAPEEIAQRSSALLERTRERSGYALGTGNSVPEYIPLENYLAMIDTARFQDNW